MSASQDNKQADLITKAVWDLNTKGVQQLLKNGADVNGRDSEGVSPLEAAVRTGDTEMVELLLENGADAEAVNSDGRSLLYTWSETTLDSQVKEWYYSHILESLLSHGAWVTDKDVESEESNPLPTILKYGDVDAASAVIDDVKENKTLIPNILHYATRNAHTSEVLRFLLDSEQFDLNETDSYGATPLHVAAGSNHIEHILMLLQHGADPNIKNRQGETPLILAVQESRPWCIEVLCAYGADINALTRENQTLAQLASQTRIFPANRCQRIIKQIALLESQGREVNPKYYSQMGSTNQKYLDKCKKEIELAKESVIDQSITYYKILTDQESNLYAQNQKVLPALYSKSCRSRFKVYGQRICINFVKVRPDLKKLYELFPNK